MLDAETAKERGRVSRLQWSNQANHRLRQELNDIAIKKCHDVINAFGECARNESLLVIFRCRDANKTMNACLHQYTNEEEFAKYKQQREQELLEGLK